MTESFSPQQQLKAFINAAQYLVGLTSGQDILEEAGKLLVRFFGADIAAFGERRSDGGIEIGHRAFSERGKDAWLPEPEMIAALGEVFESGFLTFMSSPAVQPIAAGFFPILHENRVLAVMLVGHLSADPLAKETLDLYLAAAGLIGATYSNRNSEAAVLKAKEELEQRVVERTTELSAVNASLRDSRNATLKMMEDAVVARREAEEANAGLRLSEELFRLFMDNNPSIVWIKDERGRHVYLNKAYEERFGVRLADWRGKSDADVWPAEIAAEFRKNDLAVLEADRSIQITEDTINPDGNRCNWLNTKFPYRDATGNRFIAGIGLDITERKRAEAYRDMGQEILLVLNQFEDLNEGMQQIIDLLRTTTGVEAVGIRLQQGDDYPYFSQRGFSQDFLSKENSLVTRMRDGGICMDEDGNPCLECTCGMVICEKIDPASPQCSKGGSIWTNDSYDILTLPPSEDPRSNPRNECIHHGYASVALIPIRAKGRVVGLLQLNDRRKGCFSRENIEALERIAENIGEAMLRKQAEYELKASLHEKEVLLKEIHHRVKNNLQVISSLVSLQANGTRDEMVREVLKDVTFRVRSMALVHEKLYQSADLASIDFAEYVRSLLNYLWRAHGNAAANVRLTLELSQVQLPVDTAVPCGLILNELAGNTLKHAFRGRSEGEVTVSLQGGVDCLIRMSVQDNGVGLPDGFEWRKVSSLGLRLVQMLSEQLDADVEVNGSEGTRVNITFYR